MATPPEPPAPPGRNEPPLAPAPAAPPAPHKRTLYDILGVAEEANATDIDTAYKARVEAQKLSANADPNETSLVQEAYRVLGSPTERSAYDAMLLSLAEKAAARDASQSPDFVVETEEEEAPPAWRKQSVLLGGALVLMLAAFWLLRSPAKPGPGTVAPPEPPPASTQPAVPAPVPAAPVARSSADLFADLSRSTARITVYDVSGRVTGLGIGVAIGAGTVITNCHIAPAGGMVMVKVGAEQFSASVELADEEHDLCRLSVPGLAAPAVPVESMESLKSGQKVHAICAAQGADLAIGDGIVTAMLDLPQGRVIQTTAPVSPGSSGAPLFDAYGKLVGIMTFRHPAGQDVNFAVPADWIAQMRARSATNPLLETMAKSAAAK